MGFSLSSIFRIWLSLMSQSFSRCLAASTRDRASLSIIEATLRSSCPFAGVARSSVLAWARFAHRTMLMNSMLGSPQLGTVDIGYRLALSHVDPGEVDVELLDPALQLRVDRIEPSLVVLDEADRSDVLRERLDLCKLRSSPDELLLVLRDLDGRRFGWSLLRGCGLRRRRLSNGFSAGMDGIPAIDRVSLGPAQRRFDRIDPGLPQ